MIFLGSNDNTKILKINIKIIILIIYQFGKSSLKQTTFSDYFGY
jgi:hypothetical protein